MIKTNLSIQFLLFSDGASHKFLGINPVEGLKKLGIDAEYLFYTRKQGVLQADPDYIFVLKPKVEDLILGKKSPIIPYLYKTTYRGAKMALIVSDQRLPIEIEKRFDFFVTCSQSWQREYQLRHPDKPCYLIKEEYNYYTMKEHTPSKKLKVVTMGYSVNLVKHFIPAVKEIKKVTDDITIVGNPNKPIFAEYGCKFEPFKPHSAYFMEETWDKIAINQFTKYDVGVITQYNNSGRTSTRGKAIMYAGLPLIAPNVIEYRDLWFNGVVTNIMLYDNLNEIYTCLKTLADESIRNWIVTDNQYKIEVNSGIINSAKSFLEGIKSYEKNI